MTKKLFTLLLAVAASIGTLFAWDYERVQIGGLYYNLDATNQTAEVTSQNSSYPYWSTTITTAIIPASVTYNSVSYSVTSIGNWAFRGCTGLTSIEIPNSVTSIGNWAFEGCTGLTSITIPNSVTSIGYRAFEDCRCLTSVIIPNSVTSIGFGAFSSCTGLPVIDNIRYADTYLVEAVVKTLSTYTIKEGTKWIGNEAFKSCSSLTSVTIPNSVTSIGSNAFRYCTGLTSVTIPNSVTSIGAGAFWNCTGLTSVTIPNSVTGIGEYAFRGCTGLTSIYNFSPAPQVLESNVFTGVDISNCILYVLQESINFYKVALVWRDFKNILPVESSDQAIDNTPFPSGKGRGEASKILHNGHIYILRGEKVYTVDGRQVR